MQENNKEKIVFIMPGEANKFDAIGEILKNNGLEENPLAYRQKLEKGLEPSFEIVESAALALAGKKISEDKLAELLQTHLETSLETAQNIVGEIKEKLIPYAKIADAETGQVIGSKENIDKDGYDRENFKDTLLKKVKGSIKIEEPEPAKEEPPKPNLKKPAFQNVEENAQDLKTKKQPIITDQRNIAPQIKPAPPIQSNNAAPKREDIPKQPEKPADPYKEAIE
ncbi:hypothetical protein KW786_01145 [Candidatus Parcubacteria bacterium]|nr:hypothetical protein [Candidatus Parcubacteria bacterium]